MKYTILSLFLLQYLFAESFIPKSLSFDFEQRYTGALSKKEKKGKGQLQFKGPRSIRLEMISPTPLVFVANDAYKSWLYRPPFMEGEMGEVTIGTEQNHKHAFLQFFETLNKNGLTTNKQYQVTEADKQTQLTFNTTLVKEFSIKKALLSFEKEKKFDQLKKIVITYDDDRTVELSLSSIKTNQALNPNTFEFTAPPNTKTIR